MDPKPKTVIVAAIARNITKSGVFTEPAGPAPVDGNIGESAVAGRVVKTAIRKLGSITGEAQRVDGGAHSSKW